MKKQLLITIKYFAAITIVTGIIYPLFITLISIIVFPGKASGSLIEKDGKIIGSELIGQKFESDKYFWSRPSAIDYNPAPSGGSNLGPTSAKLKQLYEDRMKTFVEKNTVKDASTIPNEMFFASASGVDPHISPLSAMLQVERVAKARNFDNSKKEKLIQLINSLTEKPQFGFLGNSVVNILLLNLNLDKMN
ncbi:MAG: potassium-transporting ATPase subunit KdpC [Ignavibacteriales bacterium]|nr:potassium-transporting ATPase subunit KdpC [Ignavibacteriales bacterium]